MNRFLRLITIVTLLAPVLTRAQNKGEITIPEIKQHLTFLASEALQGRKAGTSEGRIAAEYIAKNFAESGLKLMGEKGFQYFEVITAVRADEKNRLAFDDFQGDVGKDFVPVAFSENATLTAAYVSG